jgi:hypothetical protein
MELAQEIQNIPDSEKLLLRVINYVRGITKKNSVATALTGDALRLWNRTKELAALPQGWDGDNALPMQKKTVQNMQRLLKSGISADFRDWALFPDDNGTLLLQSKDGKASISIGNASYSFVFAKGDKMNVGEAVRFSPLAVLNTMRTFVGA